MKYITCPICGRHSDPGVFAFHRHIENRFLKVLQARHPSWHREQGACPACVLEAVQEYERTHSGQSLQHDLQLPFPIYAPDDAQLLPLAQRLRSHPRYTGRRITIAFLDSGFYPHPDLVRPRNRIVRYVDASEPVPVESEFDKPLRTEKWHGTMTSSVGAGNGFMSDGLYAGLARDAQVVLVKTGNTRNRRIHDRDIARALEWVIANQARFHIGIVNISLGGDNPARTELNELDQHVEEAVTLGMVIVAAGGNGGQTIIHSPAAAPSAIAVGGLDDQNSLSRVHWRLYPSDFGQGAGGVPKPELIAPANWLPAPMLLTTETHSEGMFLWQLSQSSDLQFERTLESRQAQDYFKQRTLRLPIADIRTLIRRRMIEQKYVHAHYQHVDGTSFAAPIVASVAAQMLEANPTLSPSQVKEILTGTARPLLTSPLERQGAGVLEAARAVAAALRAPHGRLAGLPMSPSVSPWGVTFTYDDDEAREVALVGAFNGWQPQGHALHETKPGIWQLTLPRPAAGTYPYKFLIDGKRWVRDPENGEVVSDGYGDYHALVTV